MPIRGRHSSLPPPQQALRAGCSGMHTRFTEIGIIQPCPNKALQPTGVLAESTRTCGGQACPTQPRLSLPSSAAWGPPGALLCSSLQALLPLPHSSFLLPRPGGLCKHPINWSLKSLGSQQTRHHYKGKTHSKATKDFPPLSTLFQ